MDIACEARQAKIALYIPALLKVMIPTCVLIGIIFPLPVYAHVKWFANYNVAISPAPLAATLINGWFWLAAALVLTFFAMAVVVERQLAKGLPDDGEGFWAARTVWARADDFMRAVISAFFVAIFAIGGVYLTPELQTANEWVPWLQLLIAASVFSRRTMPIAAAGIIGLWILALQDYDVFHLLDYLALGAGLAGYLAVAAFPDGKHYRKRFAILRWGVAIAVMWSSAEKLAYPDWFHPLIDERPYLTLGMPRDAFIPMAGVAEFAMGLGLLWTPLVRRLSAIALLVFFTLAVYPFGRIDLIGHILIMGVLVLVFAEPVRRDWASVKTWEAVATVPPALAGAALVVGSAYWGLHGYLYPRNDHAQLLLQLEQLICGPGANSRAGRAQISAP